jgi:annexin D
LFILHFSIYQTAVLLWLPDPAARDAEIIRKSLAVDRSLEAATEVICSRTPSQLQYLKQLHHSKFGVYLEHEIELNTSGDHQKVRFLCVNAVYVEHEVE